MSQGYYLTLLRRILAETLRFGAEQVIIVLVAIVTLALQIHYGVLHGSDLPGSLLSILWPYAGLIVLFVVYEFLRVPKLLWTEKALEASNANARIATLTREPIYFDTFRVTDTQGERIDYKGEIPGGGSWRYHLFIHPELQINYPLCLTIKEYRLEIAFHGHKQMPSQLADVKNWEMQTEAGSLDYISLVPMPHTIESDRPYEGWLHFVTDKTHEGQLMNSRLRLYLETPLGPRYADVPIEPTKLHNRMRHFHEQLK